MATAALKKCVVKILVWSAYLYGLLVLYDLSRAARYLLPLRQAGRETDG